MNVGADLGCIDHTIFLNEDVVPNVQREEGNAAERKDDTEGDGDGLRVLAFRTQTAVSASPESAQGCAQPGRNIPARKL